MGEVIQDARERTRNEETLEKLRELAGGYQPVDPAKRVERQAQLIAADMQAIHGGQWRIQIDHLAGVVMVVRH